MRQNPKTGLGSVLLMGEDIRTGLKHSVIQATDSTLVKQYLFEMISPVCFRTCRPFLGLQGG